ncbi:MAG: hypothetical protein J1G04_04260 [Clostridiales bacterium]|nr:hypothetical protein [Clostridiales bacterium]
MKSSQLLILGNGFDVHCGLRSTYTDFFRSEIIDTIGESFGRKQLRAGVRGFWESLLFEYYDVYDKNDYKWCDIETIIKDTLWSIYFGENSSVKNIDRGLYMSSLNFFTDKPQSFDKDNLKNIGKFLFDYCLDFITLYHLNVLSPIRGLDLLCENLLQQLNNLEQRFCRYLKNQIINPDNEKELNEKYIVNSVNLLAQLTGFVCYKFNKLDDFIVFQSKKCLIDVFDNLKDVHILSFNYTALFDILGVNKPCAYNNVHGKLCNNICTKDCNASSVIFGIDDNLIQSQYFKSELRLFSKTYRKIFNDEYSIKTLPSNNNNRVQIKFYGHSLSKADYSYFQSIFDYYDLYGNSNVSLVFYYSKGYEQHDDIYRLISEYGKSLTNKEQGKNLIHKLLLENRLRIQEVK